MKHDVDLFDIQFDGNAAHNVVDKTVDMPEYTGRDTFTIPEPGIPIMGVVNANKAHQKVSQFVNQEVSVRMMNNAFSTTGKLICATNKLIVLNTCIGNNKNNQPVKGDLVIMMHNVASISRNPRDME
jgi:hypothetical protein